MLTVKKLLNEFLNFKRQMMESGELAQRSLDEYADTAKLMAEHLGKSRPVADLTPGDFQAFRAVLAKRSGPVRLGNTITRLKSVFKRAFENDYIQTPVKFGSAFKKPSAKTLRATRLVKGPKMFRPEELQAILKHATPNIKTMVLLGINGGLGNTDVAELELKRLDLASGWLTYPRGQDRHQPEDTTLAGDTPSHRRGDQATRHPARSQGQGTAIRWQARTELHREPQGLPNSPRVQASL